MNATGQQPSGLPCATPATTAAVAAGPSPGCRDADIPLPCNVDRQIKHSKSQIPRLVRPAVQSQDERPRPGRRRRRLQLQQEGNSSPSLSTPPPRMQRLRNARLSPLYFSTLILVLALCSCCRPVAAAITASEITIDAAMSSALASLEQAGRILMDTRPPPNVAELRKRQDGGTTTLDSTQSATTEPPSTTTANSSSTSTSLSPTSIPTDSGIPNSDSLPAPFDSGIGTNYTTSSCPNFLKSFLSNASFKSCLPFSLLLQVSFVSLIAPHCAPPLCREAEEQEEPY
jgi:hypothetical protein